MEVRACSAKANQLRAFYNVTFCKFIAVSSIGRGFRVPRIGHHLGCKLLRSGKFPPCTRIAKVAEVYQPISLVSRLTRYSFGTNGSPSQADMSPVKYKCVSMSIHLSAVYRRVRLLAWYLAGTSPVPRPCVGATSSNKSPIPGGGSS